MYNISVIAVFWPGTIMNEKSSVNGSTSICHTDFFFLYESVLKYLLSLISTFAKFYEKVKHSSTLPTGTPRLARSCIILWSHCSRWYNSIMTYINLKLRRPANFISQLFCLLARHFLTMPNTKITYKGKFILIVS